MKVSEKPDRCMSVAVKTERKREKFARPQARQQSSMYLGCERSLRCTAGRSGFPRLRIYLLFAWQSRGLQGCRSVLLCKATSTLSSMRVTEAFKELTSRGVLARIFGQRDYGSYVVSGANREAVGLLVNGIGVTVGPVVRTCRACVHVDVFPHPGRVGREAASQGVGGSEVRAEYWQMPRWRCRHGCPILVPRAAHVELCCS